ncbi:hypothetical protein AMECASPLE_039199 [Ameca splendens]|uniref:Uncharacterized protein n=1 Tax=Ameca splendens TaxID=208324 RepID=A0ABV0YW18_9TELE
MTWKDFSGHPLSFEVKSGLNFQAVSAQTSMIVNKKTHQGWVVHLLMCLRSLTLFLMYFLCLISNKTLLCTLSLHSLQALFISDACTHRLCHFLRDRSDPHTEEHSEQQLNQ